MQLKDLNTADYKLVFIVLVEMNLIRCNCIVNSIEEEPESDGHYSTVAPKCVILRQPSVGELSVQCFYIHVPVQKLGIYWFELVTYPLSIIEMQ